MALRIVHTDNNAIVSNFIIFAIVKTDSISIIKIIILNS